MCPIAMLLLCAIVASLLTQRAVGASAVEAVVVGDGALGANNATADFAAVLGGQFNTASGLHSLVAGGLNNSASNTYVCLSATKPPPNDDAMCHVVLCDLLVGCRVLTLRIGGGSGDSVSCDMMMVVVLVLVP